MDRKLLEEKLMARLGVGGRLFVEGLASRHRCSVLDVLLFCMCLGFVNQMLEPMSDDQFEKYREVLEERGYLA